MRKKIEIITKAYALAVISFVFLVIVADALIQFIVPFRRGCDVEVFDVYGVLNATELSELPSYCYMKSLNVWGFRTLGKTTASVIVVVTHFFSSQDAVGLGVSDPPTILTTLLHPITTFYIIKGTTSDGDLKLGVTPEISKLSYPLNGKTLVLLTCNLKGIDSFARSFIDVSGLDLLIVSKEEILREESVEHYLKLVLTTSNISSLCDTQLFTCFR